MSETDYSKYTVLVVDDIPVNILLVKGMLSKLKFNIMSANSGRQALDLLTRTRPDIILMDIMMPGMNGFETTKAIRGNSSTKDIPVIILSACNSDMDIKNGLEAGANEFITKPFIQERIVNSIINQIHLSESRRTQCEAESLKDIESDTTVRMLAYITSRGGDEFSLRLADMALCMPLQLIDESLYTLTDHSSERVTEWALNRMQEMKVKEGQISVANSLSFITSLMEPAAKSRNTVFNTNIAEDINVNGDATLFKVILTNLLSCACCMADGEISITGNTDGGLANIIISFTPNVFTEADINLHVSLAMEIASRMNGAVMCEREGRQCIFQIILQL